MSTRPIHHPLFARLYPAMARAMEHGGMAEHRRALLRGLTGTVIEVGAGDGMNFQHYPPQVTRVLAVEPEPHLHGLARAAATRAPVSVEVVDGLADRLPAEGGSADAVVASLLLCSVADPAAALGEFRRVLTPGGQLRFLEHVRAETPGLRRIQRIMDATIWPRLAGGCHTGRDTVTTIEQNGFGIEHLDRFRFPDAATPTSFHVLGTAVPGSRA
ncbi:class I SAM-dependent methyltransferase [Amycolatopsis magusensis]|uniref:Ubiquinone/menaquinone biosynthesis C-methylase UbiE n=1 Tax=Amycolatopsis magusensis TaxID=882444 RepID=A0ABS4PWJ6_9PSEU|nr:class I SAM-dependent methyltransferase [Amycolatopsis magusensis]MBP2183798.1 ubiquinone/menaquinone biosynthesis C-methylase UbiE [Amycolatopsis magusensis]